MGEDYKKMMKSIDELLRPYRSIQEELERVLKPQLEFQSQMSRLLEPYSLAAKTIRNALDNPAFKLQGEIQRKTCPVGLGRSQLGGILASNLEAHRKLDELLRPQKWIQDTLNEMLRPHAEIVSSIRAQLKPRALAREQIEELINPINRYLADLQDRSLSVRSNGNVSIDGEEVSADEISTAASSFQVDQPSVEGFAQSFIGWLGQLPPRLRQAVLFLVLPYVISIVANFTTPLYEQWWQQYAGADHRIVKKEIIQDARNLYDPEELSSYRFVYATRLHVRARAGIKSQILDSLALGKTVHVIDAGRRWTKVEYIDDETGEIYTGWVFSRYLRKFVE